LGGGRVNAFAVKKKSSSKTELSKRRQGGGVSEKRGGVSQRRKTPVSIYEGSDAVGKGGRESFLAIRKTQRKKSENEKKIRKRKGGEKKKQKNLAAVLRVRNRLKTPPLRFTTKRGAGLKRREGG